LVPAEIVLESAMGLSLPREDFLDLAHSCRDQTIISNGQRVNVWHGSIRAVSCAERSDRNAANRANSRVFRRKSRFQDNLRREKQQTIVLSGLVMVMLVNISDE
jgi:hypothetical protein